MNREELFQIFLGALVTATGNIQEKYFLLLIEIISLEKGPIAMNCTIR